jgi:hypothetical protein
MWPTVVCAIPLGQVIAVDLDLIYEISLVTTCCAVQGVFRTTMLIII